MFFPRMRRHAKWMFVLLALVFGLGFVLFGVGAGGVGVGELFRGDGTSSGAPSVGDARERIAENPRDAEAFRDLATALQLEGDTDDAVAALEEYTELRPADTDALRELAGLYLSQSSAAQRRGQLAQLDAFSVSGGSVFGNPLELGENGQTLEFPVVQAVESEANRVATEAYAEAQAASSRALDVYQRLAAAQPEDAGIQLELAQTAQSSGEVAIALEAYKEFLRLAPDDPSAELVREQVKQLESTTQAGSTG